MKNTDNPRRLDKQVLVDDITSEVLAKVHRKNVRISPYKKGLNRSTDLALKVLKDPSDRNIRSWASQALSASIGPRALNLSDKSVNDIRGVALMLVEIAEYTPQQINAILKDAATYSANKADDQLNTLITGLHSMEDKKKISTKQITHDKIGNPLIIDMNSNSEDFQKPVDTRKGLI